MLATVCGYTPAQIDEMDMSEFDMLSEYWAEYPPVHLMVRAYLGLKPAKKTAEPDGDDFLQTLLCTPGWSKRLH